MRSPFKNPFQNPFRDARLQDGEQGGADGRQGGGGFVDANGNPTDEGHAGLSPGNGRWNLASDDGAPDAPPLSPSGHSMYTESEFEAWDAAGRPSNHDYLKGSGGGWRGGGWR